MLRQSHGMPPEPRTLLQIVNWATAYFKSHDIEQPRAAAEILLAHTLGMSRLDLYIRYDRHLEPKELKAFKEIVQRRIRREPVAYIVGEKGFWSLDLKVTPDVLIPRPETETLVETALEIIPAEFAKKSLNILELGTGSGAVILALATERPGHRFYATDSSDKALAVAQGNARRCGLLGSVTFLQGDWFEAVRHQRHFFDVIVSNPPYISHRDLDALSPEILRYEPRVALDGGPDGLDAIRIIIENAVDYMFPGGWLLFEIGSDQRASVEKLILDSGAYADLGIVKDYSGFDRVVRVRAQSA